MFRLQLKVIDGQIIEGEFVSFMNQEPVKSNETIGGYCYLTVMLSTSLELYPFPYDNYYLISRS